VLYTYRSVQALRALASLSVVCYHISDNLVRTSGVAPFGWIFQRGFAGVDLFFVISGFIIVHSSGHLIGCAEAVPGYLLRRFCRIFPLYWLTLLPLLIAVWLFPKNEVVRLLPAGGLSRSFQAVFLLPGHPGYNAVSWTLSFELYFYLLFAWAIFSRRAIGGLALLTLAVIALGITRKFGGNLSTHTLLESFFFNPLCLEFALGAGVALLNRRYRIAHPFLPAIAGLLLAWLFCPQEPMSLNRVWSLGPAAALILLGITQAERRHSFRIPVWLADLGDASYVLYLLHFPIIIISDKVMVILGEQSVPMRSAIGFALTAGMCWLSIRIHRHIEAPLMQWARHRMSPGPVKEKTP
jgi:exopolysaccharide production protein ExoZ